MHQNDHPEKSQSISVFKEMISGSVAGLASRLVVAPFDVLKIRYQLQTNPLLSNKDHPKYSGVVASWRRIVAEEGLSGLFKGNWAAAYLYMVYGAVQFTTYKYFSSLLSPYVEHRWLYKGLSGGMAGVVATTVSYPFDLLRTRFAAQGTEVIYSSITDALKRTLKQEGAFGLYRGLSSSIVQIFPYMAIIFSSYDTIHSQLKRRNVYNADLIAGGLAGALGKLSVMPFDVIRKRQQVQGPTRNLYVIETAKYPKKASMFTIGQQILRHEGLSGLFKGAIPSLLKAVPGSAVTFYVYNFINRIM